MSKIKMCGLSRPCDIIAANELLPEYIGFVFARASRRYITYENAAELKQMLDHRIKVVGVFVNETIENVADMLDNGIIDIAQLHGDEDEEYILRLKQLTGKPVIKAFRITTATDDGALGNMTAGNTTADNTAIAGAINSPADYILLDAGAGDGKTFDWDIVNNISRPFFLAGGLDPHNVEEAIRITKPYAVDVSSGIETGGLKDNNKMTAFVKAVRKDDRL